MDSTYTQNDRCWQKCTEIGTLIFVCGNVKDITALKNSSKLIKNTKICHRVNFYFCLSTFICEWAQVSRCECGGQPAGVAFLLPSCGLQR